MTEYTWATRVKRGEPYYEVSTKGDPRFSPFNARLKRKSYASIEYLYQVGLKGYDSIQDGKGKPPRLEIGAEQLYEKYKSLWGIFLDENPRLETELREAAKGRPLTDMFAKTPINQARALAELLNERGKITKPRSQWMMGFVLNPPRDVIRPDYRQPSKRLPPLTRDT